MEQQLTGLTLIAVLGFLARWCAWWLKLPAILLLLAAGLAVGPLTGLLDPDRLFGGLLMPLVSVSVAVILFEGGLGLKLSELREAAAVRNLVTIGVLVTWMIAALLAMVCLDADWRIGLLLGAILTVTGPTVVLPLLQQIRPKGAVASVARWEGILVDPVGALLAVLAYEAIAAKVLDGWSLSALWHYLSAILMGSAAGAIAAAAVVLALRAFLIPDALHNPFSLALVMAAFTISNHYFAESGLVAVTVMGIALANQKWVSVHHILEFKETLRLLLISSLFIVLAARFHPADLQQLGWGSALFVAGLVFVARPAAVWLATARTGLSRPERTFLAFLAPRGIVAAAVSSILAEKLRAGQVEGSALLAPVVFAVVIATVTLYGLGAWPLARRLGISDPDPQGLLIAGADPVMVELAGVLERENIACVFVDEDWSRVSAARLKGHRAYHANPLSGGLDEWIDLAGVGRVLVFTPDGSANSLAALHLSRMFGRAETYQVRAGGGQAQSERRQPAKHLTGRLLFAPDVTYQHLRERFANGYRFKITPLTAQFGLAEFRERYGDTALPFFLLDAKGKLKVLAAGPPSTAPAGARLISLAPPESNATALVSQASMIS